MSHFVIAVVDFGPGGLIGVIITGLLALLVQYQQRQSDDRNRKIKQFTKRSSQEVFVPKFKGPSKKQPKQPRFIFGEFLIVTLQF